MKNREIEAQLRDAVVVRAVQDLHEAGFESVYLPEISRQVNENGEAPERWRRAAGKVLSVVGIDPSQSVRALARLRPIINRLEDDGRLESDWEAAVLETSRHPRRRLYRLA